MVEKALQARIQPTGGEEKAAVIRRTGAVGTKGVDRGWGVTQEQIKAFKRERNTERARIDNGGGAILTSWRRARRGRGLGVVWV